MIILLIGSQGSGKGTEGKLLSETLKLPLIGVGELLRSVPQDSPKYPQIKEQQGRGVLVDYDITADVIKARVGLPDCEKGYILDGWLRALDELNFFNPNPDIVLFFNISLSESIRRLSGRRICETTGEVLNIYSSSPEDLEKCKDHLITRKDDTEEVVRKRQESFENETVPVINMYRNQGKLVEIDGNGTVQEVHLRVLKALKIR